MTIDVAETAITDVQSAIDLIGNASYWHRAEWVALTVEQLPAGFFELSTGVAGEIVQKFAQYGMGLAVVGDVSAYEAASTPFRDWVRESNRGRQLWFVPDLDTLRRLHG
ncbi:alpha/beta hydrolase [Kribbella flavida DSM 17836]|uniref:Alpha/beta hydrolase n=1 Tax=Kribbella flavida (strain DSM 17836 / JCM 10339 / NBRC 14399) TaxID=479435 RepID=D2Q0C7_KRIFD|nr:DUF4180 domain-containing protein [Kribbella flavida]ADB31919.1 alpha/beta hydrolase [Kribbella flavida DSM 17836]